jgi:hypothetical protein
MKLAVQATIFLAELGILPSFRRQPDATFILLKADINFDDWERRVRGPRLHFDN